MGLMVQSVIGKWMIISLVYEKELGFESSSVLHAGMLLAMLTYRKYGEE